MTKIRYRKTNEGIECKEAEGTTRLNVFKKKKKQKYREINQ